LDHKAQLVWREMTGQQARLEWEAQVLLGLERKVVQVLLDLLEQQLQLTFKSLPRQELGRSQ
jgi:hypothetical protein